MTLIIGVIGSSPGIGKSTLCHALAEWLRRNGSDVDHFREEEIISREEFASLAEEFCTRKRVEPDTIIDCMRKFAVSIRKSDVVVADSLLPFTPSLVGWGYAEPDIAAFLDDLTDVLAEHRTVMVYLNDDPGVALPRAVEREEPGWLDGFIGKLSDRGVTDKESACAYLRNESDMTRRFLAAQPWPLITVDTEGVGPEQTAARVIAKLNARVTC